MKKKRLINELKETGIIDIIGDAISIQDIDFRVIYQNKRHKDIVGDRTGEHCYKAYQGKDDVCDGCHLAMSFRDRKVHTVERSKTTDEGVFFSENTASVLLDPDGNIIAGIEVVRDITRRKLLEKEIVNEKKQLEARVKERTAELEKSNQTLLNEVYRRKQIEENLRFAEQEMIAHIKELNEVNIALKVILKQREDDKKLLASNIMANIKHLILPYIKKLEKNRSMTEDLAYLNIIESNLKEIVSPLSSDLASNRLGFTPKEIQIANLIKDGKQDKEIVETLNISIETAKTHRKNIRKKLGIYGKRTNLRVHLLSMGE